MSQDIHAQDGQWQISLGKGEGVGVCCCGGYSGFESKGSAISSLLAARYIQ